MTDSLRCPSCGAPTAPDALRCDYCASALRTVTCPACFASMFAGSQFCPHCGAKAAPLVEDDSGLALPCPNCNASMKPVRVGKTPMQQCEPCGGSWLTTETLTALCTDREAQGPVMSAFAAVAPDPGIRLGNVHYRRCAACQQMMNRVNFGRVSGVVVDLCKGHGVYFDPGELSRLVTFVANGGLERMRRSETEFKELSKQAWAAGAVPASPQSRSATVFSTNAVLRVQVTTDNQDAPALRQLLDLLLT